MLERAEERADAAAEKLRRLKISELAATLLPPGVKAEATDDGVLLSGRRLRRRMIDDVQLRNFGR